MTDQDRLLKTLTISAEEREVKQSDMSPSKMVIIGVVALLLIGGAGYAFLSSGAVDRPDLAAKVAVKPKAETPRPAASSEPQRTAVSEPEPSATASPAPDVVLDASGYVTARRIATVSAELTGLIKDVLIEEGMRVQEGQVLARLDDALASADHSVARARVREAEADIFSIRANLAEAKREFKRASDLRADEFASEARVTQARTSVDALEASLMGAEARLERSRFEADRLAERLADHTIRAPFAGVVTVKAAQPGEIVSPVSAGGGFTRTGICTIVDMNSLEIEVDVNESFIGRISENQRVIANLDAYPDWDMEAWVIAIIPTANRDKATVRVRVGIETGDPRVLPDMGVRVAFLRT